MSPVGRFIFVVGSRQLIKFEGVLQAHHMHMCVVAGHGNLEVRLFLMMPTHAMAIWFSHAHAVNLSVSVERWIS